MRQSVRLALLSRGGPPRNVVAVGLIHIRSNCLSIPAINDHCSVAACKSSLGRSTAYPRHDRLPPASAILDCCVQNARPLSLPLHPPDPNILLQPCARSQLCSLYPRRIGPDPRRSPQCRTSQGRTVDHAWHTAASGSLSCSALETPRTGARTK